jgi:azurin
MKPTPSLAIAFAILVLVSACSKAPESETTSAADQTTTGGASSAPAKVEADPSIPELKVEISGNDQMKFDKTSIEAKPRQKVTVTLKNVGTMPKVSMGHNFVLLTKDMDPAKFVEASQMQMANEYIAPELKDKVLASTKLLGPGESDTISFAAPAEPGDYTYICSFPGHFAIGMKGVLSVK